MRRRRVLAVDDDVVILRLVREALGAFEDCEVDTSPDPVYAFELVLKKQYDLFIFDLMMPEIDGATLFGLITKVYDIMLPTDQRLPPLILMSGHAGHQKAQDLLQSAGVRGLLAKPFRVERLIEKVEEVWRPARV